MCPSSCWQDSVRHLKPFEVCHPYLLKSEEGIGQVECTSKPQHVTKKIQTQAVWGDKSGMNKTKNLFSCLLRAVWLKRAGPHSSTELQIRTGDQTMHKGGDAENV